MEFLALKFSLNSDKFLKMAVKEICKFEKYGFCKSKDSCKDYHPVGGCRFKDTCKYEYKEHVNTNELLDKMHRLEEEKKLQAERIDMLEKEKEVQAEKINNLQKDKKVQAETNSFFHSRLSYLEKE